MKFHIFLDFSVKFIKDKSASENNLVENRKFCFVFVGVPRFSEKAARDFGRGYGLEPVVDTTATRLRVQIQGSAQRGNVQTNGAWKIHENS